MSPKERFKELVNNSKELLTIFIGDSHTYGQGAIGAKDALKPPSVLGGEIRRLPDHIPCFAQLFGNYIKTQRQQDGKTTYHINYGFGCKTTTEYLEQYFVQTVERYKPQILVVEFAINDWLVDPVSPVEVTVQRFKENLDEIIDRANVMETLVILLSVSPILGTQFSGGHYYGDYIEAMRQLAVRRKEIIFADANKTMTLMLDEGKITEDELFFDDWHVSQKGHDIYAKCLIDAVK